MLIFYKDYYRAENEQENDLFCLVSFANLKATTKMLSSLRHPASSHGSCKLLKLPHQFEEESICPFQWLSHHFYITLCHPGLRKIKIIPFMYLLSATFSYRELTDWISLTRYEKHCSAKWCSTISVQIFYPPASELSFNKTVATMTMCLGYSKCYAYTLYMLFTLWLLHIFAYRIQQFEDKQKIHMLHKKKN